MKLDEFLKAKRWNSAILARESGITLPVLRKILLGNGSLNLDTALQISHATGGKVSPWDLSCNAEAIMNGTFSREKRKRDKKKNEAAENSEDPRHIETT
jgi:hypothetical protein